MRPGRLVFALATLIIVAACTADERGSSGDGTWVGTITTEGNVTTVINESGSVWGGTAEVVEELSIGVDVGADPYMLGRVTGIAVDGERIYVADGQVPAIRVYDGSGTFIDNLGREGKRARRIPLPRGGGSRRRRACVHDGYDDRPPADVFT